MLENTAQNLSMAQSAAARRGSFIRKTYAHLAGAIALLVALDVFLLSLPITRELTATILQSQFGWLMLLGGFIVVGMLAGRFATNRSSKPLQYFGLGLYVVFQAIMFAPLLLIAQAMVGSNSLIIDAGIMTGLLFGGLTATVFMTGKDFSFLRGFIIMGGFIALGLIVVGVLFGFTLGLWFSVAMIVLASASILYDTSNIVRNYDEDQYVAASLSLFASVAMLFWYILRMLMQSRN